MPYITEKKDDMYNFMVYPKIIFHNQKEKI